MAHVGLSTVSLSVVYGYLTQLAEVLGAVSKRFARRLSWVLFVVSFVLVCYGVLMRRLFPFLFAISFAVVLGEAAARNVDRHVALQTVLIEGNGGFLHVSGRGRRIALLTSSLKTFAVEMRKRVFLNLIFAYTIFAMDFLVFVFPAIWVVLMYLPLFVTTNMIQRSAIKFLLPRSSGYVNQQAATLHQQHQQQPSAQHLTLQPAAARILAIVRAFSFRGQAFGVQDMPARVFPESLFQPAENVAEIPTSAAPAGPAGNASNGHATHLQPNSTLSVLS
eukprot:CAMPEP_0194738406 /NCGR_PEP_ID=MMETSP0296-20130528/84796_1 /TAXON_ID=39354 /ORGANISM="Heterosigma akashiwo, Strain CCMP2393" /LENGTH=276 /DNA_ID=CAMNT_0039648735 /DNA_START=39 /DNA_END=869 /DNA_ORIENTATION=-